ncbi:PDR/VanB family oxidoreductase [uncultured Nocardioides sp.]|uniref:PDR/VanB family oxidoreductase n=1 Tax=uncultured Nocardioides sp. TaxID=198441 RepID=UPI002613299E|nr:PDR/VanB family oxidoreductase [uncultured Nocardioides sp.]
MSARPLDLVVAEVTDLVPGVRALALAAADGTALPSYTPGSHLVLQVPPGAERPRGLANAYSLTGDNLHPEAYRISVLRRDPADGGAGGSAWVHTLAVGDPVTSLPPRSAFAPVQPARRHLLVSAGIGVTPLLSHLRSHARWGRDVEVLHLARPGRVAHEQDLRALAGDAVTVLTDRAALLDLLAARLRVQPVGTHLYTCGPAGFMDAVVAAATTAGWPTGRVHLEHFGLEALDPGEPFTVRVDGGEPLRVPSGTSLLEALEQAGHTVANLCRQGVCGECRLSVAPGSTGLVHRDLFLSDDDKVAGESLMACVSRAEYLEVSL